MFDLEREVAAWSAAVHAERCQPAASVAELSDHLYCEIESAREAGMSDEEAFRIATARLGSMKDLAAEHEKNRSALGAACQVAAKIDGPILRPDHRRVLVAHAMIWAAIIIASTLVLKKTTPSEVLSWLLLGVFIPLWLASDMVVRWALRREAR